jgi:hypothetical protein
MRFNSCQPGYVVAVVIHKHEIRVVDVVSVVRAAHYGLPEVPRASVPPDHMAAIRIRREVLVDVEKHYIHIHCEQSSIVEGSQVFDMKATSMWWSTFSQPERLTLALVVEISSCKGHMPYLCERADILNIFALHCTVEFRS